MYATFATYTAIVPARLAPAPRAQARPSTTVYLRRRLLAVLVLIAVVIALGAGVGNVLANRSGGPASTAAVRPASTYVVKSGDTLWALALRFRGAHAQGSYLDAMVALNGGSTLQVGQVLALP